MVSVVACKELLALILANLWIHVLAHAVESLVNIRPAISSWVKVRPKGQELLPTDLVGADDMVEFVAR